jgi:hypothetical protein
MSLVLPQFRHHHARVLVDSLSGVSYVRLIQLTHQLCGFLPCPRSDCQRMDLLDHIAETKRTKTHDFGRK